MSKADSRRRHNRKKRLARQRSHLLDQLHDVEILVPNWCQDCAPCGCPATHSYAGSAVPCISIARRVDVGFDRCLQCWTMWRTFTHRGDPTEIISVGRANR